MEKRILLGQWKASDFFSVHVTHWGASEVEGSIQLFSNAFWSRFSGH